jgi:hypothetical protein
VKHAGRLRDLRAHAKRRMALSGFTRAALFVCGLGGCVDSGAATEAGSAQTLDGPVPCAAGFAVCEGFEETALGQVPRGWTANGYGKRTLGVAGDQAARGERSLKIEVEGGQGPVVAMLLRSRLGDLGASHYGRSFLRIEGPGASELVHFDAFEGTGSWDGENNQVRWASTGTRPGSENANWSWIYNVQPSESREFGREGDRSAHPVVDTWMCLEWFFDAGAQQARFWYQGQPVDYLTLDSAQGTRTEIPTFRSLSVGFQKFQQTAAFVVWVDEIAFDAERIGCEG